MEKTIHSGRNVKRFREMPSFLNDSSNSCSSLLKNCWGINKIKYLYPDHGSPLSPGDTIVMQSKDLYFAEIQ